MFTEHVGNLQAAKTLDELKQVLEQILGDCEAALTHDGTLRIEGALPAGAKDDAVLYVKNGYIAPNDATTEPDAEDNLPNGWAAVFDGGVHFKGQVLFDQGGAGLTFQQWLDLLPVGFQMQWHDETDIPTGWAIMDGVSNASGSGINRGGRVGYGYIAGDPTFGTLGASVSLAFSATISGNGGTTSLSIVNGTTGITVADHTAHTHSVTFQGSDVAGVLDAHTYSGTQGDATAGTTDVSYGTGSYAHTGHDEMSTTSSNPNATLTHNVTDTGHGHTGTVGNNSIASGLSIGTPSTLRPAGVVELWIEKLP